MCVDCELTAVIRESNEYYAKLRLARQALRQIKTLAVNENCNPLDMQLKFIQETIVVLEQNIGHEDT